jgi:ectoine hydroxylase-related dioxygenase (phytanoyl-CoA dioxygenase family)
MESIGPYIFKFSLDRTFTKEEKNTFINYLKSTDEIVSSIGNARTKNMFILNDESLLNIKSFCKSCLKRITTENLYITESWLNFSRPGEWHHLHNHTNSFISGVFYVNVIKSLHNIVFSEINEIVNVSKGDLLLFPSKLLHYVPKNKANDLRISLSFNTLK